MSNRFKTKEQLDELFRYAKDFQPGATYEVSPILGTQEQAAYTFAKKGHMDPYARFGNPINRFLQGVITQAEGGTSSLAVCSGTNAINIMLGEITRPGDEFVSSQYLFGGTLGMFKNDFKKNGRQVRFADPTNPKSFKKVINKKTRAIFLETLANANGVVPDFLGISEIAKERNIPVIVDNTLATPYLCQPIKYGADIVIHSTTKFFSGQFKNKGLGGLIVNAGTFDWEHNPNYPTFYNSPLRGQDTDVFHWEMWGVIGGAKGSSLSEDNAVHIVKRLHSLPERMERHDTNTKAVVDFLSNRDEVSNLIYVGHENHLTYANGQNYLNGSGSVFQFDVEDPAGFINNLTYIKNLVNVGQEKTIVCHPASTTHRQLSPAEQELANISPHTIRLSVGAERNIHNHVIPDLKYALRFA